MLKVLGLEGSNEYTAAKKIAALLQTLWPGIDETPEHQDNIIIKANAYIAGSRVNQMDIILIGRFGEGRQFKPKRAIRDQDDNVVNSPIAVRNIVAVIEEKSHSGDNVKAVGDEIQVFYKGDGWSSASDQNQAQVHSLRKFIKEYRLDGWICSCVFLSNVNILHRSAFSQSMDGNDLLSILTQKASVRRSGASYSLSCTRDIERCLELPFFKETKDSILDRRKMDMIFKKSAVVGKILNAHDKKIVQMVGVGGTGKTITILQAAQKAFTDHGENSLLLTYHQTLATDLHRLMSLLKIKPHENGGGITIRTVMSFFYSLFYASEIINEVDFENEDFEKYPSLLNELSHYLIEGVVRPEEIINSMHLGLWYDRIFIDEAQDWYPDEIKILKSFYGSSNLCVANGNGQLIRNKEPANWFLGEPKDNRVYIPLKRCLRMKSSLCAFTRGIGKALKQDWDGEDNDKAFGGSVKLIYENYQDISHLHNDLITHATKTENSNIDWLFLVPPMDIINSHKTKTTALSNFLREQGYPVLDAVDEYQRRDFARDLDSFRVVQYESCRGLEGWIVVYAKFDIFLESKLTEFYKLNSMNMPLNFDMTEIDDEAINFMWDWMSMALSRAMDTIVIHIEQPGSGIGKFLHHYLQKQKDTVEIISK